MMKINGHIYTVMMLLLMGAVTSARAQEIKIGGNVYGGCKAATVTENATVTITEGTFGKNIFGGGEGSIDNSDPGNPVVTYADVNGNTAVTISGGKFDIVQLESGLLAENYNIYGGGNVACRVNSTSVQMTAGMTPQSFFMSDQYYKWSMYVNNLQNKPVQCGVFGAGYGKNTEVLGNTDVTVNFGAASETLATEEQIMSVYNLAFAADGSTPEGSEKLAAGYVANVMGGGYDGIVMNDTHVTVQGNPYVFNVFGGGLGSLNGADGDIKSTVGTVFGGATVDVLGGTIYGNVFGSGAGIAGDVDVLGDGTKILPYYTPAWVRKQTVVNIGHKENEITTGKGIIVFGNVHGGGDIANTGWYDEATRPITSYKNKAGVTMDITSSVSLYAGNVLGSVFGGGNGRAKIYDGYSGIDFRTNGPEYIGSICGSVVVKLDGAKVWGNLYGGGHTGQIVTVGTGLELDKLQGGTGTARTDTQSACTSVEIFSGWVGSNVFGGGLGDVVVRERSEDVITKANIGMSTFTYFNDAELIGDKYWNGHAFANQNNTGANRGTESDILHNLYGGGDMACDVSNNVFIYIQGSPRLPSGYQTSQFYLNASEDTGLPRFSVFGGGYGKYACVNGSAFSDINLRAGTGIFHAVCGGLNGPVGGASSMHIGCDANSLIHDVYGGGYYANIGTNTNVTITAGRIRDNVFAGGMMGDIGTNAELKIGLGEGEHVDFQDDQAGRHYSLENMHNDIIIYGSVYGGNDVSGVIGGESRLTIKGGTIMNNVYGSGNGDYTYQWDNDVTNVTEVRNDGDYIYYKVPKKLDTDNQVQKLLDINSYHPSVKHSHVTIAGVNDIYRANILGNVYCGGNASSVEGQEANIQLTLGSHATINGLYLGSDGKDYTTQTKIAEFESRNGFDMTHNLTDEEKGYIGLMGPYYATMLALYMYPVEMQTQPTINYDNNLTDLYVGTFCGGGDRGSMLVNKRASVNIPAGVTIYDKVVAGCSDANVMYHGKETTVSTTGGYIRPIFDTTQQSNNDATKLHYTIACDFSPKKLDKTASGTKYLVDNINGASYGDGCNIYGGCYKSGIIIGDVVLDVQSNMLKEALLPGNISKLNAASENEVACFNIYGAGFDMNSFVYGNVNITLDNSNGEGTVPEVYANTHPSCNNIYGGGRNGYLVGNANINVRNGIVYRHVIGGSDAGYLYGNTQIAVGDPKSYKCKTTGVYTLNRADQWNTELKNHDGSDVLKKTMKVMAGDVVSESIYNAINDGGKASKFDETATSISSWANRQIYIGGGIYGGGYALATGSTIYAGDRTVRKYTDRFRPVNALNQGQPIEGSADYGGNATIMIADDPDNFSTGKNDHITISTLVATQKNDMSNKLGLFTRTDSGNTDAIGNTIYNYEHQSEGAPVGGTTYYEIKGNGGIFGDGHLSFVEGFRSADISLYGYADYTPQSPKLLNTLQRLDIVRIKDCCIMLQGSRDFATNAVDATTYSISRIGELDMESSITAGNLNTGNAPDAGSVDKKHNTARSRNYIGFFNNVHYIGALKTSTAFANDRYDEDGAKTSGTSYYTYKKNNVAANYGKDDKIVDFKQRNLGTAPNMIGINNGYTLKIQNVQTTGDEQTDGTYTNIKDKTYYGPIVGVAEVKLLSLVQGEGGGYVYADNVHTNEDGFLNTSGNFVFPGSVADGANKQYVVDDCFPNHYGGGEAPAHYWYVEGNKYWFTNTITGYTYGEEGEKTPILFNMDNVDQLITLSGTGQTDAVRIKSITWEHTHNYDGEHGQSCDIADTSKNYALALSVSDSYDYNTTGGSHAIDRSTHDYSSLQDGGQALTYASGTDNKKNNPLLAIQLTDTQINNTAGYWKDHLSEPCKAVIVLEAGTGDNTYTYTVNLFIKYLQGPRVSGAIHIDNCALPGELIHAEVDNLMIETDESMPVTGTSWRLVNPDNNVTDPALKYHDVTSFNNYIEREKIDVLAQQQYNGWKLEYTINSSGTAFPVSVGISSPHQSLLVHNYHDMKQVWEFRNNAKTNLAPQSGARIYIRNKDGWDAFINYLNAATVGNTFAIPVGLAGMKLYMQTDITLSAAPDINVPFAGELNGDGYSVTIPSGSIFGNNISEGAMVYNLGVRGGSITTVDNTTKNCFEITDTDEVKYGKKAYDLSHYYSKDDAADGYINGNRYEGTDWQYARQNTQDSRMLRTGVTPNYGSTVTAHNMAHTPAVIEAHDCLFFGQALNPSGISTTPYPQHIDDTRINNEWVEANRVYQAEGYYRNSTAAEFYYNKEAWALQPGLTAVSFARDGMNAPGSFGNSRDNDEKATPGMQHVTKNLLVYAMETSEIAKAVNSENYFLVTKHSDPETYTCTNLALVDKEDFNAPIAFTATKASYTRNPAEETGYVEAPGTAWESICLPFSPTKATLNEGISIYPYDRTDEWTKGERTLTKDITFFYGTDENYESGNHIRHEYWLRQLRSVTDVNDQTTATFIRPEANTFAAYTPYIVSFPGSIFYEFNMTGQTVTFSAEGTTIAVTDDATMHTTVNGYTYTGAFLNEAASDVKYVMDSEGKSFTNNDTDIIPFRGWMNKSTGAAQSAAKSRAIYIGGILENAPEEWSEEQSEPLYPGMTPQMKAYVINHNIIIESNYDADIQIFNAAGQLSRAVHVFEGENLYTGFAPGVYIVNGKKMVVR